MKASNHNSLFQASPKKERPPVDFYENIKGAKTVQIVDDSSYASQAAESRQRKSRSPEKKRNDQLPPTPSRSQSKGEVKDAGTDSKSNNIALAV